MPAPKYAYWKKPVALRKHVEMLIERILINYLGGNGNTLNAVMEYNMNPCNICFSLLKDVRNVLHGYDNCCSIMYPFSQEWR